MVALPQSVQIELDAAVSAANRDWTIHARPIALAALAMEAPAELHTALVDNHFGKDAISKVKTRDYREAKGYIETARLALMEMLEGIRDNYRCDHCRSYPMDISTITEAEADEIDRFNEALDAGIMSVDAFLTEVERGL